MALHPLTGHLGARRKLAKAAGTGRLPQVLLLTGDAGVGKQRLALWLPQLVLCKHAGEEPRGSCRTCPLVSGLSHADVPWFVPTARPRAADPDKQVEEAPQTRADIMEERRDQ